MYTGAECVQSMLFAIWPRFRNVPNQLPKSANITTGFMISYFIYFLFCLPFHYIPPHQVRWFFTFKSIVTPIAGFAIIGWIVHNTRTQGEKEIASQTECSDQCRWWDCSIFSRKHASRFRLRLASDEWNIRNGCEYLDIVPGIFSR